jgi:hypothetical protein
MVVYVKWFVLKKEHVNLQGRCHNYMLNNIEGIIVYMSELSKCSYLGTVTEPFRTGYDLITLRP